MGIAKEIFGLEMLIKETIDTSGWDNHGDIYDAAHESGYVSGWNNTVRLLDQYELSEEAMLKIINKASREWHEDYRDRDVFSHSAMIAKAIKANANKIFVRKS